MIQEIPCRLKNMLLALLADQHEMATHRETVVNLRFELAQRAVELDHIETLRRLDLLNHAHEEARQKEASFVGREVYESQAKEHNKWRDEVNATLSRPPRPIVSDLRSSRRGWRTNSERSVRVDHVYHQSRTE